MSSDVEKNLVFLFQTDTTVGLASQDTQKLSQIKSRPSNKPFLKIYSDFMHLNQRVPSKFKNRVRRSSKTTFVVKNQAFRVAKPLVKSTLLDKFDWYYSTSANRSNESFNREFCESVADIIIEGRDGLFESSPSKLIKLNNSSIKVLR